jgi:4-amino-4-deoxy-L-arabinose transferase-like glycosyltransferase
MLVASVQILEMHETVQIPREAATTPLAPLFPERESNVASADATGSSSSYWFDRLAQLRFAIPSLTIFTSLLYLLNLGIYPLYTKGEPREAVTVLDIVSGGGWILPLRAGVEIPSKPLLMHWIAALLCIIVGAVNEWTVRIPSALFAIGGVLVCYLYVRRLFNARAGFVAALILGTTVQYLQAGTGARVDMTLTFFLEIGFFEFLLIAEGLTHRRVLLYVAIAMAVLTKGPVGLVLPALVALTWIAAHWRWRVVRDLNLWRGILIVLMLAGWWYVAASIVGGSAFIQKQLIAENVVRFVGASKFHEGHAHDFYYLEIALLAGFLPWTPMLAIVAQRALRAPLRSDSRLNYLLIWMVVVIVFYSLAHSKRGVYLFSMYPALATLIALYIVDAIDSPSASARLVAFLSWLYGAALALAGVAVLVALVMLAAWPSALATILNLGGIIDPDFISALQSAISAQFALAIVVPILSIALGAYLIRSTKAAHKMALGIAAGMGLLAIGANGIVVPAIANALSLKNFTATALKTIGNEPAGYLLDMDYDIVFYSRRNFPIVLFKTVDKPEYLFCWEKVWDHAPPRVRIQYQVVGSSNPTELDDTGRMLLLKKIGGAQPTPPSGDDNNFSV